MRIAITSLGAGLGARLDPHFGKCKQLLIIDDNDRFDAWPSPTGGDSGGQGVSLAARLTETECDALITGVINPQAYDVLRESGIDVYRADKGSILELVELVRNGSLQPSTREQVESSFSARSAECHQATDSG